MNKRTNRILHLLPTIYSYLHDVSCKSSLCNDGHCDPRHHSSKYKGPKTIVQKLPCIKTCKFDAKKRIIYKKNCQQLNIVIKLRNPYCYSSDSQFIDGSKKNVMQNSLSWTNSKLFLAQQSSVRNIKKRKKLLRYCFFQGWERSIVWEAELWFWRNCISHLSRIEYSFNTKVQLPRGLPEPCFMLFIDNFVQNYS